MAPPSPMEAEDHSIVKDARFADQRACTKAMRHYAASHNMTVKLATENRGGAMLRYICCGGADCRFEVRMVRSKAQGRGGYFISFCNLKHNMCSGSLKLTASQVREDTAIQELVASDPNIAGRIILEHLKRLRGATVSLSEVYRARNLILNDMFGSWEDGFQKLESLVTVWKTKNPTSYVDCEFNANGEFVRVFISHPYAPLYEMHGQKVAGVDRAILKHGKYQSDHLALVGRDGDKNNIILGIAVCASESEDNYEWFFRCCLSAGVKLNEMPLFSDRRPGVMAALHKLNVATSRFCTGHIFHNIQENFKTKVPPDMETLLYRVQAATSNDEYNRLLNTLELTHKDIAAYIRSIDPEQWVLYTALRSSRLYGWRSTNFAGYQDAAASEPRGTLPFQFLQYYMAKFMEDAYNFRSRDARSWLQEGHTLTKYARDKLKDASKAAGFCMVLPTDDSRAFVHDTRNKPICRRSVDVDARTCSCTEFDQFGIPCKHFVAALNFFDRGLEKFSVVDTCYKIEAFQALYGAGADRGIQLVLDEELAVNTQHHPPVLSSKAEGKKEKRQPSRGDSTRKAGMAKRRSACSKCGERGHNVRSCSSR